MRLMVLQSPQLSHCSRLWSVKSTMLACLILPAKIWGSTGSPGRREEGKGSKLTTNLFLCPASKSQFTQCLSIRCPPLSLCMLMSTTMVNNNVTHTTGRQQKQSRQKRVETAHCLHMQRRKCAFIKGAPQSGTRD